jgi:hypothetical protein
MSKYIDSLEWDRAENEVQRKARVIGNLATRLAWIENEIKEGGGRLTLTEAEELDFELFGEMPSETNLYLHRLQQERLRTKDLLTIDQMRNEAEAIPDKTKRLFFLIEKHKEYTFDKEQYTSDLLGWKGAFPNWIVAKDDKAQEKAESERDGKIEDGNGAGLSGDFVKQLLSSMQKEMPYLTKEMGEISSELAPGYYFPAKDMAGIIDELIKEAEQVVEPLCIPISPAPVADVLPTDNLEIKDSLKTLAAIAILHVYLGKFGGRSITQQNKKMIASQYGYDAENSGTRLFNVYNVYKRDSERLTLPSTSNRKSANEHLKRFHFILPILKKENQQAFQEATRDLKELTKMAENYFP